MKRPTPSIWKVIMTILLVISLLLSIANNAIQLKQHIDSQHEICDRRAPDRGGYT